MVSARSVLYYAFHPEELRSIIQWKLYHDPVHTREKDKESHSVSRCYFFLDQTSRSFSPVIQELHPELKLPVVVFYLCLRGLDTIEDDMTLPLVEKEPLLRQFYTHVDEEGWTFDGSGIDEADRNLLVEFDVVTKEFLALKNEYRVIIADITKKMGNGMADFAIKAEVNTVDDYNLYCHYVAGVVGEGLTRLFVESKLGNPLLLERSYLHESMGRFLQKVNIIRDVREDWEEKRQFWPKEIWSKHVQSFDDLFKPENREQALQCSTEMVLNALQHAEHCIFYLAGLKEQSVFNFCAIPQTMAIATLALVFQNGQVFERNVKITKGQACRIMIESSQDLRTASEVFRSQAHKILQKNNSKDPNFLKISMTCAKLEKFIDGLFPPTDPKVAAGVGDAATPIEIEKQKQATATSEEVAASEKAAREEAKWDLIYMAIAVTCTLAFISATMIGIAWYFGAKFNASSSSSQTPNLSGPVIDEAKKLAGKLKHEEL